MSKVKKVIIWLFMLTKKLFCRWSFLILLMLIPVALPLLNSAISGDNSIVEVALCDESESGTVADSVISELKKEKSVISYKVFETGEEAIDAVRKNECSAAWIFEADFEQKMNEYLEKESITPFVRIVEQEENVSLMLAREKLFGKLYSQVSYKIFCDFVKTELLPDEELTDKELRAYYDARMQDDKLIEVKMIGSDEALDIEDANYLKTPLRGILSLLIMLCGFAAAGYFMKERKDGIYDWLSPKDRIIPAFGSCFAAVFVSAVIVFVSIYAGKLNVDFVTETVTMLVYIFAATAFCVFMTAIFKNFTKFGPILPFMMIIMLVLCPIFFSIKFLPAVQFMIPPYYYLMSIYSFEYVWYMSVYSVITLIISYFLYSLKKY